MAGSAWRSMIYELFMRRLRFQLAYMWSLRCLREAVTVHVGILIAGSHFLLAGGPMAQISAPPAPIPPAFPVVGCWCTLRSTHGLVQPLSAVLKQLL